MRRLILCALMLAGLAGCTSRADYVAPRIAACETSRAFAIKQIEADQARWGAYSKPSALWVRNASVDCTISAHVEYEQYRERELMGGIATFTGSFAGGFASGAAAGLAAGYGYRGYGYGYGYRAPVVVPVVPLTPYVGVVQPARSLDPLASMAGAWGRR